MPIYDMLLNLYLARLGFALPLLGLVNARGFLSLGISCVLGGLQVTRIGSAAAVKTGLMASVAGLGLLPLSKILSQTWCAQWLLGSYMVAQAGKAAYSVHLLPALAGCGEEGQRYQLFSVRYALAGFAAFVGSVVGGLLPGFFARLLGSSVQHATAYGWSLLLPPCCWCQRR